MIRMIKKYLNSNATPPYAWLNKIQISREWTDKSLEMKLQYSESDLKRAVEAIRNGELSISVNSKYHSILV